MPRQMDWIDTRIGQSTASGTQDSTDIDGGSTQLVQRGTTIIRTIVSLDLFSETVAGAWGVQTMDIAIGIADREAFTSGVLPDPNSDTDKPARGWMWRTQVTVAQNGAGAPVVYSIRADIRGARKIDLGRAYIIMNNEARAGTSFSVGTRGIIRTLVKLP